jgi:hypothetical protein
LVICIYTGLNGIKSPKFSNERTSYFFESFFAFAVSFFIFLAYLKMPTANWIDWSYHFWIYYRGEVLWVILLAWLAVIVEVSKLSNFHKKIIQVILFIAWLGLTNLNFFHSHHIAHPFRLLTSILTRAWVITNFYNKRILETNFTKICVCTLMIYFSFIDLSLTKKWSEYRSFVKSYLVGKVGCIDETDVTFFKKAFRHHHTKRTDIAHHSVIWSENFSKPVLLLAKESDDPQGISCRDLKYDHLVVDPRGYTMNFESGGRFKFSMLMKQ